MKWNVPLVGGRDVSPISHLYNQNYKEKDIDGRGTDKWMDSVYPSLFLMWEISFCLDEIQTWDSENVKTPEPIP